MALLLAVLRTLVDEALEPPELMSRLNAQICRHSPASRFITLFYAVYEPSTGRLLYVNAGQNPPLVRRRSGRYEKLAATGVALGMFDQSTTARSRHSSIPATRSFSIATGSRKRKIRPANRSRKPDSKHRRELFLVLGRGDRNRGVEGGRSPRESAALRRRPDDPHPQALLDRVNAPGRIAPAATVFSL